MEPKVQNATSVMERRTQRRYPLELQVLLRDTASGEANHGGQTCDISATGLYLRGDAAWLEEGRRVHLSVRLAEGEGGRAVGLRGLGRVVRVDRPAGQETGFAVMFDQVEFAADDLESMT